jgi:hypothetical protein
MQSMYFTFVILLDGGRATNKGGGEWPARKNKHIHNSYLKTSLINALG